MRTIKDRNNREIYMHKPIGVSATKRGASLSIAETLKKTSIIEQQKMIENSPLYDEFKAGTPIESLDLLDYIDLGVQPLDLTDGDLLRSVAREQIENMYSKFQKAKEAASPAGTPSEPKASTPAEGGAKIL